MARFRSAAPAHQQDANSPQQDQECFVCQRVFFFKLLFFIIVLCSSQASTHPDLYVQDIACLWVRTCACVFVSVTGAQSNTLFCFKYSYIYIFIISVKLIMILHIHLAVIHTFSISPPSPDCCELQVFRRLHPRTHRGAGVCTVLQNSTVVPRDWN